MSSSQKSKKNTIVAFGDSITKADEVAEKGRWTSRLERALSERFPSHNITVINAGVGGNTTREGLARIENDVLRHTPAIVLVEFGNDVTYQPERHVEYEEFTANLEAIRTRVARHCKGRIILLTFPPVIDKWHANYKHPFYEPTGGLDRSQEKYRQLTRKFAKAQGIPLVETDKAMRAAMKRDGDSEYILPDGVHLTAAGNKLVADLVFEVLAKEIEKL